MGCSGCARRAAEFKAKQAALKQARANNSVKATVVPVVPIIAKPVPKPVTTNPVKTTAISQIEVGKIQPQKSRRQLRIEARLLRIAKRQAMVAEKKVEEKK